MYIKNNKRIMCLFFVVIYKFLLFLIIYIFKNVSTQAWTLLPYKKSSFLCTITPPSSRTYSTCRSLSYGLLRDQLS